MYRLLQQRTLSDGLSVLRPAGGRRLKPLPEGEVKPRPRGAPHERTLPELLPEDQAAEALARYAGLGPSRGCEAPGAIAAELDVPKTRVVRFLERRNVLRSRSEAAKPKQVKRREAARESSD